MSMSTEEWLRRLYGDESMKKVNNERFEREFQEIREKSVGKPFSSATVAIVEEDVWRVVREYYASGGMLCDPDIVSTGGVMATIDEVDVRVEINPVEHALSISLRKKRVCGCCRHWTLLCERCELSGESIGYTGHCHRRAPVATNLSGRLVA